MKKILLMLTSADEMAGEPTGYELSEAAHPWKVFRDAGYVVDFASVDGGNPSPASTDEADEIMEDFMSDATVNTQLLATPAIADVDMDAYDAIYLVGGHGTMVDFPECVALADKIAELYEAEGVVAAVCHGPAGLLNVELSTGVRLLDAKHVTGFSNAEEAQVEKSDDVPFLLEDRLTELAGSYTSAREPFGEHVVVDGRLVTGENPASAAGVAKEVVKILTERVVDEKAAAEAAAAELRAAKDAEKEAEHAAQQ